MNPKFAAAAAEQLAPKFDALSPWSHAATVHCPSGQSVWIELVLQAPSPEIVGSEIWESNAGVLSIRERQRLQHSVKRLRNRGFFAKWVLRGAETGLACLE